MLYLNYYEYTVGAFLSISEALVCSLNGQLVSVTKKVLGNSIPSFHGPVTNRARRMPVNQV